MAKFDDDLIKGKEGERVFAFHLMKKWRFGMIEFNDDYRYDLKGIRDGKTFTFEVKTDNYETYHKITNNIFVEVSCNNKPSGLSKTEADIMVFYFPQLQLAYLIWTKKLREFLMQNKSSIRRVGRCGDRGSVNGYLIDRVKWGHIFRKFPIPHLDKWIQITN